MREALLILIFMTGILSSWGKEEADTVLELKTVTVSARRQPDVVPAQTLQGEELKRLNSQSVADALRYFSGVQIKDYGGVGGLKTVNIRSMGTNHTGVVYDGVELGNAQNGQIDLGQFSLDNMESLSLYNGQRSNILQPAKDFGSAASVYMRTRVPVFEDEQRSRMRVAFRTGSFDLVNPSLLWEYRLSERVTAQLSGEWINSSGKYKFRYRKTLQDGSTAYDTTAVRQNGDINATRAELNLFGRLTSGSWQTKVYNYYSKRGIPGAIVNNVWRRGERQWDNNTMVQGRYTGYFGRWTTLNNVKYAFYKTRYINDDERTINIDNHFTQQDLYLSTANQFEIFPQWLASVGYDLQWNTMTADIHNFRQPYRLSNYVSVATAWENAAVKIQGSVMGTFIADRRRGLDEVNRRSVLTPALFASWRPVPAFSDLAVRAFYKKSFRMPTFNDLYYTDMGNSALSPEKVTQYNVGVEWRYMPGQGALKALSLNVDGYYNDVKDKIVAYPKGQMFRWTMLNLGRVDIRGIDVNAATTIQPVDKLELTLRGQYTFQRAIDVTDSRDNYYRDQIPYIPHHSGSAVLNASWKQWGVNYSWIYVGERYNQPENIKVNYMPAWYTHDVSLSRELQIGKVGLKKLLEVNNLRGMDYAVRLNYHMPRRPIRLSLTAVF
ncbi:MAG: TonB-dependent receptor [Muribaculaceae bacterium]|nr:TonB-dependent receptor [Muribaculaceae bacterium]